MTTRAMENVVRMGKENWIDPMEITTCHNITKHISSRVPWSVGNPCKEVLRYVSLARQTFWEVSILYHHAMAPCELVVWNTRVQNDSTGAPMSKTKSGQEKLTNDIATVHEPHNVTMTPNRETQQIRYPRKCKCVFRTWSRTLKTIQVLSVKRTVS